MAEDSEANGKIPKGILEFCEAMDDFQNLSEAFSILANEALQERERIGRVPPEQLPDFLRHPEILDLRDPMNGTEPKDDSPSES